MIKRLLLLLTIFLPLAAQAQYATLVGKIQASNGLNAADYTINFTPNQQGYIAGTGVVVGSTTSCATSSDGSVVSTPNPLYSTIVTPQFTGTLPPANYFVEFTFVTSTGTETLPSPETPVQLTSTGGLVVAVPAQGLPAGAAGIKVYVGTSSGSETLQGTGTGTAPFTLATPLVAGTAPPTVNNTVCQQVANDAMWPVGSGYNVSISDSQGNTLPGYPSVWQLLGPGTTINLSNGLPYYHGIVTFPSPILASPLNHASQSIAGPLNMQGYNVSNVATLTACTINGMINANGTCLSQYADIGAKVNAALAQCNNQCTVYVPAGSYSFTTPIVVPLNLLGTLRLQFDQGAALTYNGTGCAITGNINTGSPTVVNLRISGGSLFGSSTAQCGIHVPPSNSTWIDGMLVYGFSNGQGVWFDGSNGSWLTNSLVLNNQVGVYATNTKCNGNVCSPAGTGATFTPNAIHVKDNTITGNTQWGVEYFEPFTSGSTGPLNDSIEDNDLELNGSAGSGFGAINIGRSLGLVIEGNYFEGSPRQIVLGILGGNDASTRFFASVQTNIINNHFTLETGNPTYEIELQDTDYARIEGNDTLPSAQTSANCFVNATPDSGTNVGETHTYFGSNQVNLTFGGNLFCSGGTFEALLTGNGSSQLVNSNYQPIVMYGNFLVDGSMTSETVPVQNALPSGFCYATPINSGAAAAVASTFCVNGTNSVTLTHPATIGLRYTIWGVLGNLN